jgi:hypothetical protein
MIDFQLLSTLLLTAAIIWVVARFHGAFWRFFKALFKWAFFVVVVGLGGLVLVELNWGLLLFVWLLLVALTPAYLAEERSPGRGARSIQQMRDSYLRGDPRRLLRMPGTPSLPNPRSSPQLEPKIGHKSKLRAVGMTSRII